MLIHLHFVSCRFFITTVELNSCHRNCVAHKGYSVCSLAHYRKRLLAPKLDSDFHGPREGYR